MKYGICGCRYEFKTVSNRSMIRFIFNDSSHLSGYQLEMLKNNQIPGLLKSEVLNVDQEVRISFDITSLIPLKKILERKEIGRREFFRYLSQITGIFEQLENYLLDYDGVVLDSSLVYGSLSDDSIFFIYIPNEDTDQDINEALKQFIMDMIIREMKFKDENTDNYIQRLIEALKSPEFSLQTLKAYLDNPNHDTNDETPGISAANGTSAPTSQSNQKSSRTVSAMPLQQIRSHNSSVDHKIITEKRMVYPLKSWLVLGSVVLAIIFLFVAMILKGAFKPGNPDMLTTLVGLLLISAAVTWLVCSKVFAAEKKVEKIVEKKAVIPVKRMDAQPENTALSELEPKKFEYVNKSIPISPSHHQHQGSSRDLVNTKSETDRTVLLAAGSHSMPSIKRLGEDAETIVINQWPYRIGRMSQQVDYCIMNPAIGKIHAELTKGVDAYYITDMNTRNGTYINGNRIEPNTEHPLNNGDRIMLANEEFLFSL